MSFKVLIRFVRFGPIWAYRYVTVRYVFDNATLKVWINFDLYIYQKVKKVADPEIKYYSYRRYHP